MSTFTITPNKVTVIDDRGDTMSIERSSSKYDEAIESLLVEDYEEFREILFRADEDEDEEYDEDDEDECKLTLTPGMVIGIVSSLVDNAEQIKDATGVDILEDVCKRETSEHDLSNWNGSPIYYLTKEQAQAQVDKSLGFWEYHDFGIGARCGRRYATVPTGFGPTAPEGYEWACVSIEDATGEY